MSVLNRVLALLDERGGPAADPREIVLIASSSRGGSSIFTEGLRRDRRLLHLRAEVNPFFVLAGLSHPESATGSDALGAEALALPEVPLLRRLVRADIGRPVSHLPDEAAHRRYALDLAIRLDMQWPGLAIEPARVDRALHVALARARREAGWEPGEVRDARLLHALLFVELRAAGHPVDPYAYDLDRAVVEALFPELRFGDFRPAAPLVEEPPFVAVSPWEPASEEALATTPVVIKTPSNVWRLPFWEGLFPGARLRLLHLTRNVAAAVNGLWDGWNYPGFHSHFVGGELGWWKFDLPPGWEGWIDVPLVQRCAWQWRGAHMQIGAWTARHPGSLRLRFEDLLDTRTEAPALAALSDWLGLPIRPGLVGAAPPVMATAPPRKRRWFARAELLGPVLADPENLVLMQELGYDPDPERWL